MGKSVLAYADHAERDHAALKSAARAGSIECSSALRWLHGRPIKPEGKCDEPNARQCKERWND